MATRLIYQMFATLLGWIVLHTRSDTIKDIEILVLRHQLAVLQRRTPRPRIRWTDRALITALTRLVGAENRVTGSDQHPSAGQPSGARPEPAQHDRSAWPSDLLT